jgi:hypothetical protein
MKQTLMSKKKIEIWSESLRESDQGAIGVQTGFFDSKYRHLEFNQTLAIPGRKLKDDEL